MMADRKKAVRKTKVQEQAHPAKAVHKTKVQEQAHPAKAVHKTKVQEQAHPAKAVHKTKVQEQAHPAKAVRIPHKKLTETEACPRQPPRQNPSSRLRKAPWPLPCPNRRRQLLWQGAFPKPRPRRRGRNRSMRKDTKPTRIWKRKTRTKKALPQNRRSPRNVSWSSCWAAPAKRASWTTRAS